MSSEPETPELVKHLESYLGPIAGAWTKNLEGEKQPFQVADFERGANPGERVLATTGVSHHWLQVHQSEREVRQEMIMMYRDVDGPRLLPELMFLACGRAIGHHCALLLGEVIGFGNPLLPGATVEALMVALPMFFPDDFQECTYQDGSLVAIGWLVPITPAEAEFVRAHGYDRFVDELIEHAPDALDFERPSIV